MIASYMKAIGRENCVYLSRRDLDISDEKQVKELLVGLKPAVVINTAGNAQAEPETLEKVYSKYPFRLASLCCERGVRFVFLSSGRVFSGDKNTPYSTEDRPGPVDPYGYFIRSAEENMLDKLDHSLLRIVRIPMVLGLRKVNPERQGIYRLLHLARQNRTIRVAEDVIHSPVHGRMVAEKLFRIACQKETADTVSHLSGADEVSFHDLMTYLAEKFFLDVEIIPVKSEEFHPGKPMPLYQALASSFNEPPTWRHAADCFAHDLASAGFYG